MASKLHAHAKYSGELNEIQRAVGRQFDMPMYKAKPIVSHVFKTLMDRLIKNRQLFIAGVGIFSIGWRAEQVKRNPRTGEKIISPGHYFVKFRQSKRLRNIIHDRIVNIREQQQ